LKLPFLLSFCFPDDNVCCAGSPRDCIVSNHTANTTGFAVSTYGDEDGGRKDFRNVLVLANLTMYRAKISIFNKRVKLSSINFGLDYSELIRVTGTEIAAFIGTLGVTFNGTSGVTFIGTSGVTFIGTSGVACTGTSGVTFRGTSGVKFIGTSGVTFNGISGVTFTGTSGMTFIGTSA